MLASVTLDAVRLCFSGFYQEELLISLLWQSKRQGKKQDLSSVDPFGCVTIPCCLSLVIIAAYRGVISSAQEAEPSAFQQALLHSSII